jgi:hypothetical protein
MTLQYPGADLDEEIIFSFDELAECFYRAVVGHNDGKMLLESGI